MSVRMRLKRIERAAREAPQQPQRSEITDEDWLEWYTALGAQGVMNHEPDFPVAIEAYRRAIEEAIKRNDPPFYPPEDFELKLPLSTRRERWRGRHHFPGLTKASLWLIEMILRMREGIPPVSEVEFAELTNWFKANSSQLHEIESRSFPIVIDGEEMPSLTNIYYKLTHNGPRKVGAGEVAQHVRRLRAAFGDGE